MATINLIAASQSSFIKTLGNIATGRHTCGGTLPTSSQVQLNYLGKDERWGAAMFPLGHAELQEIIEASTVASFGRGKKTVTDKSYRDAYALDPEKCTSSFQLCNTGILGEVRLMLVPDAGDIRAELYKMNVYTGPSGHFKAHVDTPRGGLMFGSLVVCLPSQFTGGALVTRHDGLTTTYDWSSSSCVSAPDVQTRAVTRARARALAEPRADVRWAAFFGDVEHEILPVTAGHRVTLTYNLYHCDQVSPVPSVDITTSLFYSNLKEGLSHPHFLRDGDVLGFACQHAYVLEEFDRQKNLSLLLKGSDHTVLLAAKALHLEVEVKPVVETERVPYVYEIILVFEDEDEFFFPDSEDREDWDGSRVCRWEDFFSNRSDVSDGGGITWCQELSAKQPGILALGYGNDSCEILYQAAAILVTIPRWGE